MLEHNHILTASPNTTRQMVGHKLKDPIFDDMIDNMHRAKVKHVNVMKILRETVGGQENMTMSERDIQNR